MHTVFALLCFVVVIHWLIFPYPSGLLHWHCGNLTIAPVPAKQPWWIRINTSCEFIMNDCITTTKQSTTKPCAYFLGYTVCLTWSIVQTQWEEYCTWDQHLPCISMWIIKCLSCWLGWQYTSSYNKQFLICFPDLKTYLKGITISLTNISIAIKSGNKILFSISPHHSEQSYTETTLYLGIAWIH